MSLEKKITNGKVTYIHSFYYDDIKNKIQFNCLYDPKSPDRINLIVTFNKIFDLNIEQVEKDEENYLQQVIGIDEYKEGGTMKYIFQTDIKTIIFKTEMKPLIKVRIGYKI